VTSDTERNYVIQDQELLAVVRTLEHFYQELYGSKFTVVTDHEALVHFATKRFLNARQARWADFLANFTITWRYRPGSQNVVADALSRKTTDFPTVKARELEDRTRALIPPEQLGFKVAAGRLEPPNEAKPRECEAETPQVPTTKAPAGADLVDLILEENRKQNLGQYEGRIWVPELTSDGSIYLRTALIREAHEPHIFAHPGRGKITKFLQREYYWPEMKKTIDRYERNCRLCRRNKINTDKTPGLLHPLPIPDAVWDQVVVDGKDMPPDERGYNYVWVFICKFSRILATLPGRKNDTAEVLAQRYYQYLYRFFGVPAVWISDNAGPFISEFLAELNRLTGTKHRHGSALHPQTQGAVERTNRDLDQKLRFYIDAYQTQWSRYLPALDFRA
jgi:hypothetical protein